MPYQAAKDESEQHEQECSSEAEADHSAKGADLLLFLTKASRNPIVTPVEMSGCFPGSKNSKSGNMGPPVPGNRHHRPLYHSPIKVNPSASSSSKKQRGNTGGSDSSSSKPVPYPVGYAPAWSPSSFNGMVPVLHASFGRCPSYQKQQTLFEEDESISAATKRSRPEAEEKKEVESPEKPGKQRFISPSSSNEKIEDESESMASSKSHSIGVQQPGQHPPMYQPPLWRQQPGYPSPAPYMTYPHPPPYAAYPHFPPHHPWGMYGAPPPVMQYPAAAAVAAYPATQRLPRPEPAVSGKASRPNASKQRPHPDWQGSAPSLNRCVLLKHPVPNRYWSNASAVAERRLPDFSRLVNFPDNLSKGRNLSQLERVMEAVKHCVMCGKGRLCPTNCGGRRATRPDDDAETTHIIPRQNKGVCTECDVAVWVVREQDGLEIKWCKGCKNFRPWAAFGDKGLATKCARCRKRQKDKYATQKSETRLVFEEQKEDAAVNGLRNLMNGSVRLV